MSTKKYDAVIIGAGPAGIYAAYEFIKLNSKLKICILEKGRRIDKRVCPIGAGKISSCAHCKVCDIMSGFGGAGGFSDGKYNITNNFGGNLYSYVGDREAIELMQYVDAVNMEMGGADCKLYSTINSDIKRDALRHDLHLLDARVRHLGTDTNKIILANLYDFIKDKVEIFFETEVLSVTCENKDSGPYHIETASDEYICDKAILAVGRSGSKWFGQVAKSLGIETRSNKVDIGVRVELPALVFEHLTNDTHEVKICYRTKAHGDVVRTFCMNPYGIVVSENTNGIVTVNGHSYREKDKHTENTNFALLVSNTFSEPFNDSNAYGEHIARLSNMLSGGVMVQRLSDLMKGRRTTAHRLSQSFVKPTLDATPGDLSLVIPKRQLDDIIEMINALENIAPGTANGDTLLYGVEVKFYNSTVKVDNNFETKCRGLYVIGDCGGTSHSLSVAASEGVYCARTISKLYE